MIFLAHVRFLAYISSVMILSTIYYCSAFAQTREKISPEKCQIALEYMKILVQEKDLKFLIFVPNDSSEYLDLSSNGWYTQSGKAATSPSIYLLNQADANGQRNALPRCENVSKWISQRNIKTSASALATILRSNIGHKKPKRQTAIIVNVPVLNKSGNEAVIIVNEISGPLAAVAYAVHLKRGNRSAWEVASLKYISVA